LLKNVLKNIKTCVIKCLKNYKCDKNHVSNLFKYFNNKPLISIEFQWTNLLLVLFSNQMHKNWEKYKNSNKKL